MKSVVRRSYFRNVMDMNSNLGGFGAALKDTDVWVMNVSPVNQSARLKIIYDRGLIGTVHDWYACNLISSLPYLTFRQFSDDFWIPLLWLPQIHTSLCCTSYIRFCWNKMIHNIDL